MSRAASAAASLPLRNSNFCRTTTDGRAVIVSASFDELGEKRYAQPGGEARGFRLLGQRAGRAGLDAAQATLAVAVIHAGELARGPAAFLAVFPDQAEIGAHQVAQPAVDAPLPVENRQRSGARCRKVVPHRVARLGDDCADRLRLIAPRRLGPGGRQNALSLEATASGRLPANPSDRASRTFSASRKGNAAQSVPSRTALGRDFSFTAIPRASTRMIRTVLGSAASSSGTERGGAL